MNKKEFSQIRHHIGKTQLQMAQLLGISLKAVQSFEQGWRRIPVHTERQSLLLLALKGSGIIRNKSCWTIKDCPAETRRNCPAWEFGTGQICWLVNGTICQGKVQKSWSKKMEMCKKCEVLQTMLSSKAKSKS
jgi:DNA-binding XRE family transcriptional regulator